MERNIVVIGVGNILYGDDGVGVHAVNQLRQESFPPNVKIMDAGTAGIDLLYLIEDTDYAIIVDCLDAGDEPGAVYRIPWEELAGQYPGDQTVSLHDLNLWSVLSLADRLGKISTVVIFGVQPDNIGFGSDMSAIVSSKLPYLVQSIKKEIANI